MADKTKILVIEDDDEMQETVKDILEADGYEVILVDRGAEGVKQASKERPDLILLDIRLPDFDGEETLRRIKRARGGQRIPVIVLTAVRERSLVEAMLTLGVKDYIVKPFHPLVLTHKVREALSQEEPQPGVRPFAPPNLTKGQRPHLTLVVAKDGS